MLLALFLTCFVALAAATALKSQRFRWCSEACRSCASTGGVATLGPASRQPAVGLPGLGQLAWPSVTTQDLPVIIGTVLVASAFIVVANLLVDLGYALLDPRVRPSCMNAQQARRRREAQRAQQAAQRRRERRLRLGMAAVLAVVLVAGVGVLAVTMAGHHQQAAASPGSLADLQTGPAPWAANTAGLAERLQAIGVPPLNAMEGTAVHIHQHLDLYVGGHKVVVPAGIGIDPAVGFAPLHTHDASGVIHVESPTVRTYTLGEFFAVWGVRFTPSCLGGYCAGGGRQLRVYVNGQLVRGDPTAVTLTAHQELVVAFGTTARLPSPVPSA